MPPLRLKLRKAFVARFEHPLNRAATCRNVVPIATVDMTTSVAQHVAPLCTPPRRRCRRRRCRRRRCARVYVYA